MMLGSSYRYPAAHLYACLKSGIAVSGDSWIMPNGTVAPGKVCPSPPVPMRGSTSAACPPGRFEAADAVAAMPNEAASNQGSTRRNRTVIVNLEFGSIQVDTLSPAGKQRMLRRDVRIS